MSVRPTPAGPIGLITGERRRVHRIGYEPDPFAWTPWQYANDGRFDGRWDDPDGNYRTIYIADELFACLLEVLADFRPDLELLGALANITDDDGSDEQFPTAQAGTLSRTWLSERRAGTATLTGEFCDVRSPQTIATLRVRFGPRAGAVGLPDLDASAIKLSAPRGLTQAISSWTYQLTPPVSGVCFGSRFGDDLTMWAVFEQPGEDVTGSSALFDTSVIDLDEQTPALVQAMRIHGLKWTDGS